MKRTTDFQTIRSEGGRLPPDLLRRVLDPNAKLAPSTASCCCIRATTPMRPAARASATPPTTAPARLRDLASNIKGSRHGDLWRQFQLLVGPLSGDANFATARARLITQESRDVIPLPDSASAELSFKLDLESSAT